MEKIIYLFSNIFKQRWSVNLLFLIKEVVEIVILFARVKQQIPNILEWKVIFTTKWVWTIRRKKKNKRKKDCVKFTAIHALFLRNETILKK